MDSMTSAMLDRNAASMPARDAKAALYVDQRLSPAALQFLKRDHQLFIDGRWSAAQSGETLDVFDPSNGQLIGRLQHGGSADIDRAVDAARRAFESGDWSRVKPAGRTRMMFKLAELLEQHGDELAEIESIDNGKPITAARHGIAGTAEMLRYMAGWATKLTGETVNVSMAGEWHAYTTREPIGVVAQIIPWNFPLNMAIWKIAPALAAGCTIVLKPAEQASLVVLRLAELIQEAGIPNGVVNVVTGLGSTAGAALAMHPGVDKVAFTGSTATGKRIAEASLGNLKRVSLELGGKSPVIVFPDADLESAALGAAHAIFFATGQTCSAGSRLYVHRKVFDQVIADVIEHGRRLKVGHGLDPSTEMGPVVSAQQWQKVNDYLDSGRSDGARVIATQNVDAEMQGYFVAPTVILGATSRMRVVREEIFGPVVCAIPFDDDLESVAAQANDSPFGLFASIWTRDLACAHRLSRRLKAGTVGVNTHFVHDAAMPFGGFKQSGWGRERGAEVLGLYTEVKSTAVRLA
jgi:phenylacetaldehyde dehydrogenase